MVSGRSIMIGRKYILPEKNKYEIKDLSKEEFVEIGINDKKDKTLEKVIMNNFNGISKIFIKSLIQKLEISNTISEKSLEKIYTEIINIIDSDIKNVVCKKIENGYTIYYSENENKDNLQINSFLDEYYYKKGQDEFYNRFKNNILKVLEDTLDKITKKIENIEEKQKEAENYEYYEQIGNLIISNIYNIKNSYDENNTSLELTNFYDNNKKIIIDYNYKLSPQKNSEKYYKKYKKLKNQLNITDIQKKEAKKELEYLESLIYETTECNSLEDLENVYDEISESILFNDNRFFNQKQKKKYGQKINSKKIEEPSVKNYIKIVVDDYEVFIGKNNKQNDYLTLRVAKDNDLWMHVKNIPGSHLIIKCNGNLPKMDTLEKCASYAAYFSRAKFSSHVQVDYTLKKYVKKPKGSNAGFVIYTNQKTLIVDPKMPNNKI